MEWSRISPVLIAFGAASEWRVQLKSLRSRLHQRLCSLFLPKFCSAKSHPSSGATTEGTRAGRKELCPPQWLLATCSSAGTPQNTKKRNFVLTDSRERHKPLDQEPSGRGKLVCSLDQNIKAHLGMEKNEPEEQRVNDQERGRWQSLGSLPLKRRLRAEPPPSCGVCLCGVNPSVNRGVNPIGELKTRVEPTFGIK